MPPASIKDVLALPGNSVALKYLVEGLRQRMTIPVVGPAVSAEAGYPPFRQFLEKTAEIARVKIEPGAAKPTGVIASEIISVLGRLTFMDMLEETYSPHSESVAEDSSAACLARLALPHVMTTNVDLLLDDVFANHGQPMTRLVLPLVLDLGRPPSLYKLYGDIVDRERIVVTEEDWYQTYDSASAVGAQILNQVVTNSPVLLVGYRYPGPASVLKAIERMPHTQVHYAIAPPYANRDEAIRFYAALSIRPIWLPEPAHVWLPRLLGYLAEQVAEPQSVTAQPSPKLEFPPPEPPDALIEQCRAGECVAVVGSGLSARAGVATWTDLVEGMVTIALKKGALSADAAEAQYAALREHEVNAVADQLAGILTQNRILLDYLGEASKSTGLPKSHELLRGIPFSALVTTNYDDLLERALATSDAPAVYTSEQAEQLLGAQGRRQRFLLKLYGSLEDPASLIYSPSDYQARVGRNPQFLQFLEGLFFSRTLLFLGMSLDGITDFLSAMPSRGSLPRKHYALVAVSGVSWRVRADTLLRRFGVEVIPYGLSDEHPEVDSFLEELRDETADFLRPAPSAQASRLRKIIVKNIGPFEYLELDFNGHWTVLLGDNGVGKSSILKALAVAIAGNDARSWAGRIVRAGQSAGSIHVLTDKNPQGYVTEIYRKDTESDVISLPSRCLEAEGWVALGFPPLRTVSWKASDGPQTMGRFRPSADDVLPMLRGDADPRMDKLKQWIVNLDSSDKAERLQGKTETRAARTLAKFFEIVTTLTDGLQVSLDQVTPNFQVMVKTADGVLPIEALSQGMTSLFSWVGILLQRLFEVNESAEDPSQSHAVVLMDEIDAHMHPAWQQVLVHRLKKIFGNVQFVVSTHSPLIVSGMDAAEVVRFRRDADGRPGAVPVESEMTKGRADQILTGELFGLPTTLPPPTTDILGRYQDLLGKAELSREEQQQLRRLEDELDEYIPPTPENPVLRYAQDLIEQVILSQSPVELKRKAGLLADALTQQRARKQQAPA